LSGERYNARNNARCMQARKTTCSLDGNIKTWRGFAIKESITLAEDKDKQKKYVHGAVYPRLKNQFRDPRGKQAKVT